MESQFLIIMGSWFYFLCSDLSKLWTLKKYNFDDILIKIHIYKRVNPKETIVVCPTFTQIVSDYNWNYIAENWNFSEKFGTKSIYIRKFIYCILIYSKSTFLNSRIDDSYRKEYPPINSAENPRTEVFVNITIMSVGPFKELDMKFGVKFLIQVFLFLPKF